MSRTAASPDAQPRATHTDWLHHRLIVTGPDGALSAFQAAVCGAGTIPWQLDLDRIQEDLFHMLMAPASPQRRRLSPGGAHALSAQLRDAVARRHDVAAARVGHSQACAFDLHALLPVPAPLLRLGPDDPAARAWLLAHWGTADALRHVAVEPSRLRASSPAGTAVARFTFWSADWTPWQALATAASRWPSLAFDIRPTYGVL